MKKVVSILFCCYLLAPVLVSGQILNIDKSDTSDYAKKAQTDFQLSSGLEVDRQQITLWDATNKAEFMLQKNRELLILSGSYRFTYNGPDDILNAGFVHLRFRHNYKNKYQPETFFQYQWDSQRGLAYRTLAGMNMRYNLWKGDKWDFNAGLGLMYEEEKWNYDAVDSTKKPADTSPITNRFIKINSYIRMDVKIGSNSDMAMNIFLQTLPDSFQPRIAPHIQWNIKAGKHTGFSIGFSGVYDEAPVVPIHRFYYSFTNSLTISL
ncbi:MAG: hypothetical protein RLZZ28_1336 [Bacteroidota bacterium]|jgi:hypothetical protein